MPFERPTLSALRDRTAADLNAALPGADSRLRRSVLDVLARTHAGAMNGAYGYLDYLGDVLPDSSREDVVVRWASIMGIQRKSPSVATGIVILQGVVGSAVPVGVPLVRPDGARYVTTLAAVIGDVPPNYCVITVEAEEPGVSGNSHQSIDLTFVSPLPGVASLANVFTPGLQGGQDEEPIDELRQRVLEVFRDRPAGGKGADYIRWAKEITGVTRAWVTDNVSGLGTVGVQFVLDGRDDIIPQAGDVSAVANHIADLRPICADVIVTAPTPVNFNLNIHVSPNTTAVREAVSAEIADLLRREAEPGGTILLSHIREAVSIAAGENDHSVVSPTADVTIAAGQIAILGTITWS